MSNSSLVSYVKLSPNKNSPRNHVIDTITIHCVVGQCAIESLGALFANPARQGSSNYGIGYDGRIGLFVEEKDRSWCTGGYDKNGKPIYVNGMTGGDNDHRAITIEVASDTTPPYAVTPKAYEALIALCTDICKRNNIKQLLWKNDKTLVGKINLQNMTMHRWFANKDCPGEYLASRFGEIANRVNANLGKTTVNQTTPVEKKPTATIKIGDVIKLKSGAKYINGKSVPPAILNKTLYAREIRSNGDIVFSILQTGAITGVVAADQLQSSTVPTVSTTSTSTKEYVVRVTADSLNIRKGPGTSYQITGIIKNKGAYTIVETNGEWGRLKSGAGWIYLAYTKKL